MAENRNVFEYAFLPVTCRLYPDDGGFRITLLDQGTMLFDRFNASQQLVERMTFQLDPEVSVRIRHLIGRSSWWINSLQKNRQVWFRPDCQPDFISSIRLEDAAFCLEDIPHLMECPFRQLRGHYTRMMYNLLEDISTVLLRSGVNLTLTTFDWNRNLLAPLEYQPQDRYITQETQAMFGA